MSRTRRANQDQLAASGQTASDASSLPQGVFRLRARCVSGKALPEVAGITFPRVVSAPTWQWVEVPGLTALLRLIEAWGCPVTLAPPEEGAPYYSLELEDGRHGPLGSLLDQKGHAA
jgi:hypothetical protein